MDDAHELAHKAYLAYTSVNFTEAMNFASQSIELDAGHVYAWYVKGCVFQELKSYSEAIHAYRKGLEGNPLDANCLKGLANACFLMEDYAEALRWNQMSLKSLGPSKSAYNMIAKCKWKLGEPLQAIEFYEKSSSLKLDHETKRQISDMHLEIGDYDKAIIAANQAIEISQENPENIMQLSRIYEHMENMVKALETLELILAKDRNHIGALDRLGNLHYKLGNLDKSESTFQHILKIDQNNLNAMTQLSVCYFDRKKYLIAVALLEKVNELYPNDPKTLFAMAKCLYYVDRKVSSLYYLEQCISMGQNDEAGHLLETIRSEMLKN